MPWADVRAGMGRACARMGCQEEWSLTCVCDRVACGCRFAFYVSCQPHAAVPPRLPRSSAVPDVLFSLPSFLVPCSSQLSPSLSRISRSSAQTRAKLIFLIFFPRFCTLFHATRPSRGAGAGFRGARTAVPQHDVASPRPHQAHHAPGLRCAHDLLRGARALRARL